MNIFVYALFAYATAAVMSLLIVGAIVLVDKLTAAKEERKDE